MAATVGIDQPEFPELTATPNHKRKRHADSSSPESRRKRGAAAAAAATALAVSDAEAQSFLEDTVGIAQAAQDQVNVDDFQALQQVQQATADHSAAPDSATASSTAAAALSVYPTLNVPQATEETFAAQAAADPHHDDTSFNGSSINQPDGLPHNGLSSHSVAPMVPSNTMQQEPSYRPHNPKPAVGSEEWHKMRKDNHKEVERRRRETINEGINELAKIVPGCERNKGQILQRAVSFITQLKDNEHQNIEKWTLEKLLTEQAIAELSQSNDKLKTECERLYRELETWKKVAQSAGLQPQPEKEEASPTS